MVLKCAACLHPKTLHSAFQCRGLRSTQYGMDPCGCSIHRFVHQEDVPEGYIVVAFPKPKESVYMVAEQGALYRKVESVGTDGVRRVDLVFIGPAKTRYA